MLNQHVHDWIPHYEMGAIKPINYLCSCGAVGQRYHDQIVEAYEEGDLMANGLKAQSSSADRFVGRSTIYGKDGVHRTPYMTRWWVGRLRFHIFHRPDQDPDPHDHPWNFWTFPLTSYVEEVMLPNRFEDGFTAYRQVVPAFWLSFRPATHTHRVLGRWDGQFAAVLLPPPSWGGAICKEPTIARGRKIVTILWRSAPKRPWGFLKNRDGRWCWTPWKEYVFGTGKSAPCE